MDKCRRLTEKELGMVDGGKMFLSIDGGEPVEASVNMYGGKMCIFYDDNGTKKFYDTGVVMGNNLIGGVIGIANTAISKSNIVHYTYKASSSDIQNLDD